MGCLHFIAPSRAYSYTPLPDNRTIRVLTLYGGNPEDPLKGQLEPVPVDAAGDYEPLSYVWGDDTLTHKIFLPTARLRLTASLYHALRRLRPRSGSRRVWADQVCIDQRNEEERSQHVQVWLGLDEQGWAKEAFAFVRRLARLLSNNKKDAAFNTINDLAEQPAEFWVPLKHITALPWVSCFV
jgi:hypothetical protein